MDMITKNPQKVNEKTRIILDRLEGVKEKDGGHFARCPAHKDIEPSLSIKFEGDRVLLHCFAGCSAQDITGALGLKMSDLFLDSKKTGGSFKALQSYSYHSAEGDLVFQTVKGSKDGRKSFFQRRPGSNSRAWTNNLQGIDLMLYNLPEVLKAREVFIVEGEKDVEAARAAGLVASCNPMGAGKWKPEYNKALQGKDVFIIPDDDAPGRKHAEDVARSLQGIASSIKVINLPNPNGKQGFDLTDWLDSGGTAADLQKITLSTGHYKTNPEPEAPAEPEKLTELGNARRLERLHGQNIKWIDPWAKWLCWDGARWAPDQVKVIDSFAEDVARDIDRQASEAADSEERKQLRKWAQASERRAVKEAAADWAKHKVAALPAQFDADAFLLACRDKTIDLNTGAAREPARGDLISKLADVNFNGAAKCPEWLNFLDMIMGGNAELIAFLQKAVGYSLTGAIDERCIFILHGTGRNGKTTFIQTIAGLLKEYAQRIPTETLLARRTEGIPNDIAALKGIRFAYAEEAKQGRSFSEGKLKDLTGGTTLPARFMRAEWFEFKPAFKLWLCTNHKPIIKGTDDAIWDRIRLIPFRVKIPDAKIKPLREVEKMFSQERAGILNWALEGALKWIKTGLQQPEDIKSAGAEYRAEMDILKDYFDDCCIFDKLQETPVKELYENYIEWAQKNGEKLIGKLAFGDRIREKGIDQYQQPFGKKARAWLGIGLKNKPEK